MLSLPWSPLRIVVAAEDIVAAEAIDDVVTGRSDDQIVRAREAREAETHVQCDVVGDVLDLLQVLAEEMIDRANDRAVGHQKNEVVAVAVDFVEVVEFEDVGIRSRMGVGIVDDEIAVTEAVADRLAGHSALHFDGLRPWRGTHPPSTNGLKNLAISLRHRILRSNLNQICPEIHVSDCVRHHTSRRYAVGTVPFRRAKLSI